MSRGAARLKRTAILIHRWMGVVFCLLFTWWFVSGIVMMYWDYPDIREADRLERAAVLEGSLVRLSPKDAYARLGTKELPDNLKLAMFDDRPVYRFRFGRDDQRIIYADDGTEPTEFPPGLLLRAGARWSGQPAHSARFEGLLTEPDQWTVAGSFRDLRPLRKYSWPDGEEVYVSEVTGQVAQYTTRGSRLGAYFGAIPHWLYFTPLRKNGRWWSRLVIWLSGIATGVALLGLILGVWVFAPAGRVPYSGQKRLHVIFGLFFGTVACTWAFSGMLSMEPFPLSSGDRLAARLDSALRGGPVDPDAFAAKSPGEALAEISHLQVKELELISFAGEPVYLATGAAGHSRIVPLHGAPVENFDRLRILQVVERAIPPATLAQGDLLARYDAYYLDRHHEAPLPVLRVRLNDAGSSRFYIDPRTAHVVGSYASSSWMNRWLYHGLHSINLPWLYTHRPAWDIVVALLLAGGAALSVTSVILAGRLLRKTPLRRS